MFHQPMRRLLLFGLFVSRITQMRALEFQTVASFPQTFFKLIERSKIRDAREIEEEHALSLEVSASFC
jgi:hypothetical protein